MAGKEVVDAKTMVNKIRSAIAARSNEDALFLLARTDAIEPEGLDAALRRAELYLKAGADGVYFYGIQDRKQMRVIGTQFRGVPLATTILERGGTTPWTHPAEMLEMGFNMVLYPTTLLFRQAKALQDGLEDLKAARPLNPRMSVDMFEFEKIVDIAYWKLIEQTGMTFPERVKQGLNKLFKRAA
jgi:2-methylisocitrate lyase-like PEP mutase family enzyme